MKLSPDLLAGKIGVAPTDQPAPPIQAAASEQPLLSKVENQNASVNPDIERFKRHLLTKCPEYNFQQEPTFCRPEYEIARQYIKDHNFQVEVHLTLANAILRRISHVPAVSLREADILARQEATADSPWLQSAMQIFGAFIHEGPIEIKDNVYELRQRYNHGLTWKKNDRHKAMPEAQAKGDERLTNILNLLAESGLPAYPHEIADGFAKELLKPEHMTWDKFGRESQLPKAGYVNQTSKIK